MSKIGSVKFGDMVIDVVDSVTDYVELMKQIFDFNLLRSFFASRPSFRVLFDGMHGGKLLLVVKFLYILQSNWPLRTANIY